MAETYEQVERERNRLRNEIAGMKSDAAARLRDPAQGYPSPFDLSDSELRLMAGEMTAQELRTVRAVLNGLKARAQEPAQGDREPVNETLLRTTDQADVWAREFAKVHPEIDQSLMIGWFANCAENAKDLQRWRAEVDGQLPSPSTREAVERCIEICDGVMAGYAKSDFTLDLERAVKRIRAYRDSLHADEEKKK